MIRFRHRGCPSEAIRYVGQEPLVPNTVVRAAEWQYPNGRHPNQGDQLICPDCGKVVMLNSYGLEPIPEETAET